MLDPWRLAILRQLSELGTVRAVAGALHMSPSSVSQQLATLEHESGAHLLERSGRRVRLTPVGVALAQHAAEILDHIESVEAEISGLHSEPTGTVRVAAFTSVLHAYLVPAVRALRASHPRIAVVGYEAEPSAALPALRRGELDLVISGDFPDSPEPSDPDLVRTPLARDDVVLVVAASGDAPTTAAAAAGDPAAPGAAAPGTAAPGAAAPGAAAPLGEPAFSGTPASAGEPTPSGAVRLADLAEATWVFEKPGAHLADLAERLCLRSGFRPRVAARCTSSGALLHFVEAGLAVTLLPRLAVTDRYAVRALPLAGPLERDIHLVARRAALSRRAVREVAEAIGVAAA